MLRIGFDLDGVIARTQDSILTVLKSQGKIPATTTIENCKWFDFAYNEKEQTGFPGVTLQDLTDIFMTREFWSHILPFDATIAAMRQLSQTAELYIVTDRRWFPELEDLTAQWLENNKVPHNKLLICKGRLKGMACEQHKISFFIDDNVGNISSVAPYVQCAYVYPQPWNAGMGLPENAVRPYDIYEIVNDIKTHELLCSLENQRKGLVGTTLLQEKRNGLTRIGHHQEGNT